MNDDSRQTPDPAEVREARRTAYVFGELDETEAAQVESEMNAEPQTRLAVDELRQLRAALAESRDETELPASSPPLRKQILDRLQDSIQPSKLPKAKQASWNRRRGISLTFACVTAVCLVGVLLSATLVRRQHVNYRTVVLGDGSVRSDIAPREASAPIEVGEPTTPEVGSRSEGYWAGVRVIPSAGPPAAPNAQKNFQSAVPSQRDLSFTNPAEAKSLGYKFERVAGEAQDEAREKTRVNAELGRGFSGQTAVQPTAGRSSSITAPVPLTTQFGRNPDSSHLIARRGQGWHSSDWTTSEHRTLPTKYGPLRQRFSQMCSCLWRWQGWQSGV